METEFLDFYLGNRKRRAKDDRVSKKKNNLSLITGNCRAARASGWPRLSSVLQLFCGRAESGARFICVTLGLKRAPQGHVSPADKGNGSTLGTW